MAEKYSSINPYAYALNNPISLIDPDGMDPEEPLKNILLLIKPTENQLKAKINAALQGNENWHMVVSDNIVDGAQSISDYLGDTQADNIVISSHGSVGQLRLNDSEESTGQSTGKAITSTGATDYANSKEGFTNMYGESKTNTYNALETIGSKVSDGGSLIFTGCRAGADGGSLGQSLQTMFGKRFDIYLNTVRTNAWRNTTDATGKPFLHLLNSPLTNNTRPGGFIKVTPNGEVIKLGKTLQLNSRGAPVTVVSENDPDPTKFQFKR